MPKRTIDETGLPRTGSLPANSSSHAQKKRKSNTTWKPVPVVEVPSHERVKTKECKVEGKEGEREEKRMEVDGEAAREATSHNYISTPPTTDLDTSNNTTLETSKSPIPRSTLSDQTFTTNETPTTFPRFRKLPPELRAMIWAASILPRIVPLKTHTKEIPPQPVNSSKSRASGNWKSITTITQKRKPNNEQQSTTITSLRSTAPIPSLLHVYRESRALGLTYYTLSFGTSDLLGKTYFNFAQDTLYLPQLKDTNHYISEDRPTNKTSTILYSLVRPKERNLITHLALPNPKLKIFDPNAPVEVNRACSIMYALLPELSFFENAKNITVVRENFFDEWEQGKAMGYGDMGEWGFLKPLFSLRDRSRKRENMGFSERRFCKKYQLLGREEDGGEGDEDGKWKAMPRSLFRYIWGKYWGEVGGEERELPEVAYKVLGRESLRKKVEILVEEGFLNDVAGGGGFWREEKVKEGDK